MRRTLTLTTLFYFAVALVATSAFAEPPVPSWRGAEGSTFQAWSFNAGGNAPDTWQNEYGNHTDPGLGLSVKSQGWFDSILGADGVYALSYEIDIVIPNNPVPNDQKDILLHLVWRPLADVVGGNLITDPFLPDAPLVAVWPFSDMMTLDDALDGNGWHHSTYEITIWPNPPKEWFTIKGNILVDYIAIDTICVPEPATIALLTLGSLCTLRFRRRNR
jgi:hypothetical protein